MTPEEIQGRILYRDALMLVINKPAGIAVHQSHPNAVNRDVYIEQYFPALQFGLPKPPMLAHRLDKDTSGCLVLGRHRKALDGLSRLFREGLMEKTYWAIAAVTPHRTHPSVTRPLSGHGLADYRRSYLWRWSAQRRTIASPRPVNHHPAL